MLHNTAEPLLIKKADVDEIERLALRYPTKDGKLTPVVLKVFVSYMSKVYGIDLQMETEQMKNERIEREAKESKRKGSKRGRMARKSSRNGTDDF